MYFKPNLRYNKHMRKRWLIIALILAVMLCLSIYHFLGEESHAPSAESATSSDQKAEPVDETIMLVLPDADPIVAIEEDYNASNSLWVVVNKDHPLASQDYRPDDLILIEDSRTDKSNDERSLRQIVVDDFNAMLKDASTAGYDLIVGSGFRSYDLQNVYYSSYVRNSGQEQADKYSAKPGYSEHQTGLVADVSLQSMECYLSKCFGDTDAGKWIADNAADYGFIVRYPADKTEITKYQYEPWHLRYVGKDLARALTQSGLTLDEAYHYLQETRTKLISANKITSE